MTAMDRSTTRRRILFLTPQLPYPPEQGTAIRNYNLIAQVAQRHDVALLSFAPEPPSYDNPLKTICHPLATVLPPSRSIPDRLRTLLASTAPDMARRLWSPTYAEALRRIVTDERFDIVQVEGIELASYAALIRQWLGKDAPAIVFDDHNAEYMLQRRAFETDVRKPARWPWAAYSFVQWRRLARFERRVCLEADGVVAVSDGAAQALKRRALALEPLALPNGVDVERYHPGLPDALPLTHPAVVFTGKMDFRPNIDAMLWFCREVWPLVAAWQPDARLYIVGKNPAPRVQALAVDPSIIVTGYVPDIVPYFGGADVYIAPLRIGGGTRLKILEALAAGLPLVATTVGAEGISVASGEHCLLADAPTAFADAVMDLIADREHARRLGARGRDFVLAHYDWRALAPLLDPLYYALAQRRAATRS